MIRVFITETNGLPDPIEDLSLLSRFSFERRDKILRLNTPSLRKERFGSELLLFRVFESHGKSPAEIFYGKNGKPLLTDFEFNVSHSGGKAAAAVSDCPVGCDLEKLRPYPQNVAKKILTDRERGILGDSVDCDGAFFRIWTAKESYLKMTGEGLSALSSVEIIFPHVYRNGIRQDCDLHCVSTEGFMLSVCGTGEFTSVEAIDPILLL